MFIAVNTVKDLEEMEHKLRDKHIEPGFSFTCPIIEMNSDHSVTINLFPICLKEFHYSIIIIA